MNPQQQSQMPPNPSQQVPDHRLNEMNERMRQLELQNAQLRGTVDFLKQGPGQNPGQAPQPSAFKPEVESAIAELVNKRLAPMETQYKQQIGFMVDQLDQAKFQLNYGGDKFAPYQQKVAEIHQREMANGRYIPREEILRMVHFEETGKKSVQPQPQQQPAATPPPVWDPFFQAYIDPTTGKPVQAGPPPDQQQPDPQNQQQNPAQQQFGQPQVPAWQQPPQPQQAPPPQNQQFGPGNPQPQATNHPYGNAYGQNFNLPGQGMNNPAAQGQGGPNPRAPLNLETATEADLQAFENSFGEIPL